MILGDATGEVGPFKSYKDGDSTERYHNSWYSDGSYFLDSSHYWFTRGGTNSYGVLSGTFSFNRNTGVEHNHFTSRLVLAP